MKNNFFSLMFFALFLISMPCFSLTWFNNVTLTSASYYWDGVNDVWEVTWQEDLNTGCAASDGQKKATWRDNSNAPDIRFAIGSARLSPAMAAVAAGLKVDLNLNLNACHASYGAGLEGIRIHK